MRARLAAPSATAPEVQDRCKIEKESLPSIRDRPIRVASQENRVKGPHHTFCELLLCHQRRYHPANGLAESAVQFDHAKRASGTETAVTEFTLAAHFGFYQSAPLSMSKLEPVSLISSHLFLVIRGLDPRIHADVPFPKASCHACKRSRRIDGRSSTRYGAGSEHTIALAPPSGRSSGLIIVPPIKS